MKQLKKYLSVIFFIIFAIQTITVTLAADGTTVNYSLSEKQVFNDKLTDTLEFFNDNATLKGDFDKNGSVTLTDARNMLKIAAKLSPDTTDEQILYSDLNCDGKITVIDARLALRIVAKLDTVTNEKSKKLEMFNALINSVKPSETMTMYYYKSEPIKVTYDNQEAVNNFNSEMRSLANNGVIKASFSSEELDELKSMDLGKMLTETDNSDITVKYKTTPYYANRLAVAFPIAGNKNGSLLTVNDISDIQYNATDSTEFNIYSALSGSYDKVIAGPYTINGASLTIYFNDESISSIPDNQTELHHGKGFDLSLASDYSSSNTLTPSDNDEISTMGEFSGEVDSIKYSGSYIKLYFNNDVLSEKYGKPVFVDYHLSYCADIYTHIAMSMSLKIIGIDVNIDDYITLSNYMNETTQYYFINNAG